MARTRRVKQFTAGTLIQALSYAQAWMKANAKGDQCWFRGVTDASLSLQPGAYWREEYDEFQTLLQFSQEGRAFGDVGEVDDWKTYYLAQHNGIPTRLLDWSENFITALFFATDGGKPTKSPCVWIVRPAQINRLSIDWPGLVSPERNEELNGWMPTKIASGPAKITTKDGKWVYDSSRPLALYPRKNNARMIAQQGTFTVHGTDKTPLESWILKQAPKDHHRILCKIVFSKKLKLSELKSELDDLGLRRSTIYPDLPNFVLDLKERNAW